MSSIIPHEMNQISRSAIRAPAPLFSYGHALALREKVLASGDAELPLYLLAPEVTVLLSYLPDLRQRLLIETLWNTGARLNEALALTPACFHIEGDSPFVVLKTLKQRQKRRGRPKEGQALKRIVPLLDENYVRLVHEYLATFRPKKYAPLWVNENGDTISDETPRSWLRAAVTRAKRDGVTFSLPVITPKTFRHSFAMHLVQSGVAFKVVQTFMGHKDAASTEVYTRIFALDVGAQYGVRFSMAAADAMALVRRRS
ncbi:tyrosine-type recombinase/integrase [Yersinia massiliensis]|uniref:Resolvase n=1 Tax=Yersinia massiliensis TaxID=419257 RepID=A0ABM6V0F8_9GAMM|nr:tyrosine-type recombinase/integrase [Yersinia massiliensis]AVX40702.1 resolvase [Yersinia massiliensis]